MWNVSPSAGCATAPAVRSPRSPPPRSHRATWTAQSSRGGSENSRVPSSGSTIHTRVGAEAHLVVLALLGQHRVVGAVLGQQPHQQLVGGGVAGVLELAPLEPLAADLEQPASGLLGQPGREHVVVGGGGWRAGGLRHPVTVLSTGSYAGGDASSPVPRCHARRGAAGDRLHGGRRADRHPHRRAGPALDLRTRPEPTQAAGTAGTGRRARDPGGRPRRRPARGPLGGAAGVPDPGGRARRSPTAPPSRACWPPPAGSSSSPTASSARRRGGTPPSAGCSRRRCAASWPTTWPRDGSSARCTPR